MKTRDRIAFINAQFEEFLRFKNKDFQKISSFLKISMGLDDDGQLANALQYDDPELPAAQCPKTERLI